LKSHSLKLFFVTFFVVFIGIVTADAASYSRHTTKANAQVSSDTLSVLSVGP